MAGIVLAFKNYRFDLGIFGSEWAGLKHFQKFITSPEFWTTIRNTLVISGLKILICFPAPIILALLLNEVRAKRFKRVVQTLSYLPNFVSWVVVVQLMTVLFTPYGGIVNQIRQMMGLETVFIMGEKVPSIRWSFSPICGRESAGGPSFTWRQSPAWIRSFMRRRELTGQEG